jgi:hypothetical protein
MSYACYPTDDIPRPSSVPSKSEGIAATGDPSYLYSQVRIGVWHGARERGETGVEAIDGTIAFSVFEIPAVPDFSSLRFPDLAQLDEAQRIKRVGERQNQFIAALHSLGPRFGISLRYIYERISAGEGQIRLFLLGRCYGKTEEEAIRGISGFREIVQRAFPSEYRLIDLQPYGADAEVSRAILSLDGVSSIAEILKPEQRLATWHSPELCGFSFYYSPLPFASAENNMVEFCRSMTRDNYSRKLIVDICLVPTGPITETERMEIAAWMGVCERWSREQRIRGGGGLYSDPMSVEIAADPHAQEARKAYGDLLQRYGGPQSRCFIYSFRTLWWEDDPPQHVAASLASFAVAANSGAHICLVGRDHPGFQRALNAARYCYVTPAIYKEEIWQDVEAPETLRRLHRMVDVKEASGFFRLPISGHDGCPGFQLDTGFESEVYKKKSGDPIIIGNYIEGVRKTANECSFTTDDLKKHCLIVGTPGSGKTTLCFSLLAQLWQKHGIPFIAIEPAKTEYRTLKELPELRDDLLIFSVGNERTSPFRFNPFEVIEGLSVSEHISALNDCFGGAFDLWGPLPMILDQSIQEIYFDKDWSEYGVGGDEPGLAPPTMEDFYNKALNVAQSKSYRGEFAGNLRGSLETRLGALLRGPKGRCFNARRSIPVNLLMSKPVIFELDALNDEEKALMMMFILNLVREHAKSTRKSGSSLKHVVLVEEAHNVIGRDDARSGEHRANPKEKAIRYFTRMLAEMRALGEGIIIADQLPTAIAPEAVKMTNIKVMHRLVSYDDRIELGRAMILDEGQIQQAAAIPPGQSFVFKEGDARAKLVIEPYIEKPSEPDDKQVREWMAGFQELEEVQSAYLPYNGCAECCRNCNQRIREQSERMIERKKPIIEEALAKESLGVRPPLAIASEHFFRGLEIEAQDTVRWGCAIIHFREKLIKHLPSVKI